MQNFLFTVSASLMLSTAAFAQCPPLTPVTPGSFGVALSAVSSTDDGSELVDLSTIFENGFNYYGTNRDAAQIYVNANGNITFEQPLATFTPFSFPIPFGNSPIIAPYFGDVDLRGSNATNTIWIDLDPANDRVLITWDDVEYYAQSGGPDQTNTFQMILTDRSDRLAGDFDVEFRYQNITWTTGSASGGSGGLGGTPAQVGFDAGDQASFFSHPLSQIISSDGDGPTTDGIIDIDIAPSNTSFNHPDYCSTGQQYFKISNECSDGFVAVTEECDDGDGGSGDGCDSFCRIEPGWACNNDEPSVCLNICGDSNLDTAYNEQCDDGNIINGDGCSDTCQIEFDAAESALFVETVVEGAAPSGYNRDEIDPTNSAKRKTPQFIINHLNGINAAAVDAGCDALAGGTVAGRWGVGTTGVFNGIDESAFDMTGTYSANGATTNGTLNSTAFGTTDGAWGAIQTGGTVKKAIFGLGGDDFVAMVYVKRNTRTGYYFGLQGTCANAWEAYSGWYGMPITAPVQ